MLETDHRAASRPQIRAGRAAMDQLRKKKTSTVVFSSRLRKNERVQDDSRTISEQLHLTGHRSLSHKNPSHTRQRDMSQLRLETNASCIRLPPINPNKDNLITSGNSLSPRLSCSPHKQQGGRKYSSRPEVHGETSSGSTTVVQQTTRRTENVDVILSSYLGPVLSSGNVHYTRILPPIGETYKIRAKNYYPMFDQKRGHSDDGEFSTFYDGEMWMEDIFQKMRRIFISQDNVLRTFLCSVSCYRRGATCCELDTGNGNIGVVEFMRQKLMNEVLCMYYL